jgi:hypothetical protein
MSQRRALDVIQVNKPCPADWNQMAGDDSRRFCTHCQKFVHNLSAMPSDSSVKMRGIFACDSRAKMRTVAC